MGISKSILGKVTVAALGLGVLAMSGETALATTTSGKVTLTAQVVASCAVSNGSINFGSYNPASTPTAQTGTFSVTCTNSLPYGLSLDAGANAMGPLNAWNAQHNAYLADQALPTPTGVPDAVGAAPAVGGSYLASGSNKLNYSIASTIPASATGSGAAQTYTFDATIAGSQLVPAGSYTDDVSLTVTY